MGVAVKDEELIRIGALSIEQILYRLSKYKTESKIVIALDGFQNLAKLDSAIPSIFQKSWDLYLKDSDNVMLILSGSSISMMRSEVLGYSAPLYGRSTSVFKIKPLALDYAIQLMPKKASIEDKLYMYFIFGGIPAYYSTLSDGINNYDNADIKDIIRYVLNEGSIFTSEPSTLLSEEVKSDTRYMQILDFIANGVNKPSEIASKMGIAQGNLYRYMGILEYMGLVAKEMPITDDQMRKSKRGFYIIKDNFIDFYFKVLKKYLLNKSVESVVNGIGLIAPAHFEELARELLIHISNKGVIFPILKIGRWWGLNPEKPRGMNREEIDVVAFNSDTKDIIFAECKWTNKQLDWDVYSELKRKAKLVQWHNKDRKEHYALFSKSGFTNRVKMAAKENDVMLFDLKEIEKILKQK